MKVLILLLPILGLPIVIQGIPSCESVSDLNVLFADDEDRSYYYQCIGINNYIRLLCGSDMWFSFNDQSCKSRNELESPTREPHQDTSELPIKKSTKLIPHTPPTPSKSHPVHSSTEEYDGPSTPSPTDNPKNSTKGFPTPPTPRPTAPIIQKSTTIRPRPTHPKMPSTPNDLPSNKTVKVPTPTPDDEEKTESTKKTKPTTTETPVVDDEEENEKIKKRKKKQKEVPTRAKKTTLVN